MDDSVYVESPSYNKTVVCLFCDSPFNNVFKLWHRRLGHPNDEKILSILNSDLLLNKNIFFVACSPLLVLVI